jgi:glycerol-3-phosphate dehydrogenase
VEGEATTRGALWYRWPGLGCGEKYRLTDASRPTQDPYDVAIIGAGVVGCALAYELSQYRLRIILIEKNFDVGEGTSKANSAIIHTGFDATPDTLESRLVSAASREWCEVAERLKVPMIQTGAIVVAVGEEEARELPAIHQRALENGVDEVELIDADRVKELEPHVSREVRGGLLVEREGVIDPFGVCVAYAETALTNGADILFGTEATGVEGRNETIKTLRCDGDLSLRARIVVNVAGLWGRKVADLYDGQPFDIHPRRGQFLLYDKDSQGVATRILLPIPTKRTKGTLVAPTIFGNILAGPTAEDLAPEARCATGTTPEGLREVQTSAERLCPEIVNQPPIAAYAGLRCHCSQESYRIRFNDGHRGFITVTGVRSTGLTSSFLLARHLIEGMVAHCGLEPTRNPQAARGRPDSSWPGWWKRPFEDVEKVTQCPDYARVVCSCEQITRGELSDSLASPLRPHTLDALKRRTRVLTGRCQGFHCGVPVAEAIRDGCGVPLRSVTKRGPGSELVVDPTYGRERKGSNDV